MKATIDTIRNLERERAAKTAPLILELGRVIRDDEKPAEYRQRRERELRAEISRTNDDCAKRVGQAANEAAEEPRRRYSEGSELTPAQYAKVQLIVQKYANRNAKQERDQLKADIAADLKVGNLTGARIKAEAAETLGITLGPLAAQLNDADPAKRDARHSHEAIEALAKIVLAEPTRELAMAGFATMHDRVTLKTFADDLGLRPDAPFPAQVEPGYTGPSLKDGVPLNAFPEPHDPERDRQRAQMDRIGRDGSTPDDTAARYARRSQRTGEAASDNLRLYE